MVWQGSAGDCRPYADLTGYPESAGLNRHVGGDEEPYRKGSSESILASSLAGDAARWRLKRRQRYPFIRPSRATEPPIFLPGMKSECV